MRAGTDATPIPGSRLMLDIVTDNASHPSTVSRDVTLLLAGSEPAAGG
jgi:hypothetical protein